MFAIVRETTVKPGHAERIVRLTQQELGSILDKISGFVGYTLAMPSETQVISSSFFEDKAGADESTRVAGEWVKRNFADIVEGPPRVTEGPVIVRERVANAQARYGIMRRFSLRPEQVEPTAQKVRDGLVPILRSIPGFASYAALDCGNGKLVSLAAFADRESADAAAKRAQSWATENLPDVPAPEVTAGDIKYRHINEAAAARV